MAWLEHGEFRVIDVTILIEPQIYQNESRWIEKTSLGNRYS